MIRKLTIFAFCALAAVLPQLAGAQDRDAGHSVSFRGEDLGRALELVVEQTGIDIAYSTELVDGKRVFCRSLDSTIAELLRCVLAGTGLDYLILSSGTFVLKEAAQIEADFGVVTGAVRDAVSGLPLAGAHVLLGPSGLGAVTNQQGRFALAKVLTGRHRLTTTYLGYADREDSVVVRASPGSDIRILLAAEVLTVEPVIVNGLRRQLALNQDPSEMGVRPQSHMDPVRETGLLAGVQIGDVLSDLHVQGGDSGEHQFRLDGATVFVPLKLGGLIGPFSPLALGKISVEKAGFEAGHGSHLSGIISAEHGLDSRGGHGFEALIDPLAASARVTGEGGSGQTRIRWMLAGRTSLAGGLRPTAFIDQVRTWSELDPFLFDLPFVRLGDDFSDEEITESKDLGDLDFEEADEVFGLDYSDIHGAARIEFGPFRTWTISGFRGRSGISRDIIFGDLDGFLGLDENDIETLGSKDRYGWTNDVLQTGYEWVVGPRTFASLQSWWSRYELDHAFSYDFEVVNDPDVDKLAGLLGEEEELDRNGVAEFGITGSVTRALGQRHTLAAGLEVRATQGSFDLTLPHLVELLDLQEVRLDTRVVRQAALFVSNRTDFRNSTALDVGARLTYFDGRAGLFVEPRISLRKDIRLQGEQQLALRVASGIYRQFHQQVDVGTYQFDALVPSFRVWMPVPRDNRPPISYHAAAEALYIPNRAWEVGIEAYRKWTPHALVIDHVALVQGQVTVEEDGSGFLRSSAARSAGLAIHGRRQARGLHIEIRYDFEFSQRRIPGRFQDAYVQSPWNAPHRGYAAIEVPLGEGVSISSRARYATGRTWGLHRGYYDYLGVHPELSRVGEWDLQNPEAHRLPDLFQMDLGLSYGRNLKGVQANVQLSVINVLNRSNVAAWSLDLLQEDGQTERFSRLANPRMPFGSLRLSW
ncbi:MAG: hypothetical protein ACI9W4_002466 [Rhodothermales bacterium]